MGFGKNDTGVIIRDDIQGALGALAAAGAVVFPGPAITDDFRILKMEGLGAVTALTAGEFESLQWGICNADLSSAQVAAAISAAGPLNRADRDKQELAMRNVKIIGDVELKNPITDTEGRVHTVNYPQVTKHRWTYSKGVGWEYFIFNRGGVALTSGAVFRMNFTIFGLWL